MGVAWIDNVGFFSGPVKHDDGCLRASAVEVVESHFVSVALGSFVFKVAEVMVVAGCSVAMSMES